jgi:hypothetical protein
MRRIAIVILCSASSAWAAQGREPVLLPPGRAEQQAPAGAINTRPFGALETRPVWDRPATPADGLSLQQRTESALDRGNGRVEDATTFELRQIDRQQLGGGTAIGSAWEQAQSDRDDQIEQLRLKAQREGMRQQRIERESESLAEQRRQWQSVLARENAAGGAVIDRQALDAIERDYRSALSSAAQRRDAAFAAAGNDRAARDAAARAYESAKAAAINARQQRREVIFGGK